MKLEIPPSFYEIKKLRERIGVAEGNDTFSDRLDPIDEIVIELEQQGIDVTRDQIISHGPFLLFEGKVLAILYIYDYRATQEDLLDESVTKKGPKFHFSWCETLDNMEKKGKFQRYIFSRNKKNRFKVQATERDPIKIRELGEHHEMNDVLLFACKNCLKETGYKGYTKDLSTPDKNKIVENFKIDEFLSEHEATVSTSRFYIESQRIRVSDETVQPMIYTNDFPEISRKLREEYSWTCSKCKVDMSNMKAGLHVHHKNGVKNDNNRSNLQVLCALCHQGIDEFHKKMHVSEKQKNFILSNRPK